jgi:hypothetical protein
MKLGREAMYLNIIKATHDKPIANIILNSEKLKQFPLKSRAKNETRVSSLSALIQYSPDIPNQSNKTGRRTIWNSNGKGRSQTVLICR